MCFAILMFERQTMHKVITFSVAVGSIEAQFGGCSTA